MSGGYEEEDDYWNTNTSSKNVYSFGEESIFHESGLNPASISLNESKVLPSSSNSESNSKTTQSLSIKRASSTDELGIKNKILDKPALTPSTINCATLEPHQILVLLSNMNLTGTHQQSNLTSKTTDPKLTVRNIVERGAPIEISHFRSRKDKILLLENALLYSHGDLITATVLFMRNTLKKSIFIDELKKRPVAISHYVSYLEDHGEYNELVDFFNSIERHEDALMIDFYQAIKTVNLQRRLNKLKSMYKELKLKYQKNNQATSLATLIESQIKLLESKQIEDNSSTKTQTAGTTADDSPKSIQQDNKNRTVSTLAMETQTKFAKPLQYIFSNKPFF